MLGEALEAARAIGDEESRSAVLAALAPRLAPTERDQALREALEAARAIEDEEYRSEVLAALAPHLTEPATRRGAGGGAGDRDEGYRSQALAALAPRLAELGHPAEALEAARAIEDERGPVRGAGRAGPPPDRAGHARRGAGGGAGDRGRVAPVRGAGRAGPPPDRAGARRGAGGGAGDRVPRSTGPRRVAALAPRLAPTERDQALREALEAARAIGDEEARSAALAALAPHLTAPAARRGAGGGAGDRGEGPGPRRWPRWPPA